MHEWNLKYGDLQSLTLAADARFCVPDYYNDQIWELKIGGGDPPAIALQTTYGLRARNFRIFPIFYEGDSSLSNPSDFSHQPQIRHIYPNFLSLFFYPYDEIEVIMEFWAAESQAIAGRISLTNQSSRSRQLKLELVALLTAATDGTPMAPAEIQAAQVLSGRTAGLAPVVFMTGGVFANIGSYPTLTLLMDLLPGSSRQLVWSHAALHEESASFNLARDIAARNWDAEFAHIEMANQGQIEIHSGDSDWDTAFALTQKVAFNLFTGPTDNLPYTSFVQVRNPDQGYSIVGDGSDYGPLWNGQSAFDAYTIANLILPASPNLARGLLMNFLSHQDEDGIIDWKPGLGGQRGNRQAAPLLVELAWLIYQSNQDQSFLEEVFPHLHDFIHAWFSSKLDRDQDGIPEWENPIQAGFEDHPLFARWYSWSKGIDITTVESPVLCALLYRECQNLIRIAQILGRSDPIPVLEAFSDNLRSALEASWSETTSSYHYWDRDNHITPSGDKIGERQGSGHILIHQSYDKPIRLVFHLNVQQESTRQVNIFIHGVGVSGHHHIERISSDRILWFLELGTASSDRTYTSLEYIEIKGLADDAYIIVYSASLDHLDHTLLLPLWSGMPSKERAYTLVNQTVLNPGLFWRPFGLSACPKNSPYPEAQFCEAVHMTWNNMIGEGLLVYGYRDEAAQLVINLMQAVISTIKRNGCFFKYYNSETGQGWGERDALGGLAPLPLFLKTLGVRILSTNRVALEGHNPFPWPITVKYKGLSVLRQKEKTLVVFPDGQTTEVTDPSPCIIAIDST
jgi:hypothetical protein